MAHDGQISGEVFVYGSISSGVVVRVYAQSTWTSSTITTGNWANIGPATVDAGWNRVRVTLESAYPAPGRARYRASGFETITRLSEIRRTHDSASSYKVDDNEL